MAYHSLPKQYNINEIKGFLHSNSIGVDTLQVHSRLFICPTSSSCISYTLLFDNGLSQLR